LAHIDEAPSMARMSRQLVEHGLRWSWTDHRVEHCLRNRDCVVLAARDRRRLVGFAIMEFHDVHAHLALLAVQPGYQRLGIGRQLLEWLEASARTAGIFSVRLELRSSNDAARRFYERIGYREAGSKQGYYDGREDALRMVRDLTVVSTSGAAPP
jgi:ribosomal-protein-alanine acetyltransferase